MWFGKEIMAHFGQRYKLTFYQSKSIVQLYYKADEILIDIPQDFFIYYSLANKPRQKKY